VVDSQLWQRVDGGPGRGGTVVVRAAAGSHDDGMTGAPVRGAMGSVIETHQWRTAKHVLLARCSGWCPWRSRARRSGERRAGAAMKAKTRISATQSQSTIID
jgi:hypothetical protein